MTELTKEQLEGAVRKAVSQMAENDELATDRQEEQREQHAASTLVVSDLRYAESHGLEPSEVLERRYGVDVDEFEDDPEALHAAVAEARSDLKESQAQTTAGPRRRGR